jgi:hypothetical protein
MSLRSIILWDHLRGTWQYDLFCLSIVAFIFLTPKAWFEKKEKLATQTARVIVKSEDFSMDRSILNKQFKEFSGNPNAEIVNWHEKNNENGETFHEIEIKP